MPRRSGTFIPALCSLLSAFLLIGVAAVAQVETATLSGTVTDKSGAVLVGAKVQATNTGTQVSQSTVTDSQGRYRLPDLPVGSYAVQASQSGFQTVVHNGITLTVGASPLDDFALPVGQTSQTVEVQDQVSQVETQTSAVGTLVSGAQIRDLPLNGRNFEQLFALAPGVQFVPQARAGGGGSQTFYGESQNYSVSGSRPVGQAYLLDNQDLVNFFDHAAGSSVLGTSLGVEAIGEFQVLTNTYSAQFGGTGAAINAVSRSGTNLMHGSAYDFLRNSALDAKNYFDTPSVPIPLFHRNQFGGSVGGPIVKDKAFFFVNYEGLRSSQGQTANAFVPDANVHRGLAPAACGGTGQPVCDPATGFAVVGISPKIAPILALYPLPNGAETGPGVGLYTSVANQTQSENYVLGRFDYNLSSKDTIFARYISDRANQLIPFPAALIDLWPEGDNTKDQYFTIEERRTVSPKVVNSVRFSFTRTNETASTVGETPALNLIGAGRQDAQIGAGNGVTPIGAGGTVPFFLVQNKFFGGDDLFWTHGSHTLKFGVSIGRVQTNLAAPFNVGGNFTFASLETFLQAQPLTMLGMAAPSPSFSTSRYFREIDFNPYFQDDWRVTSRLTVNLGLRYEFASNATAVGVPLNAILNPLTSTGFTQVSHVLASNPNVKNFDPRIGLAYDPFNDHKTSIRAGFGMFHEPVAPRTYAPAYYLAPPSGATILIAPGFPNPYAGGFGIPYIAFAGIDYHTDTSPYVIQYNLNVQRQLFSGTVFSVGYVGSSGVHLFSERDLNTPLVCTSAPASPGCPASPSGPPGSLNNPFTGAETNPNFGSLNGVAATSHSNYNSLQAALNRQFSHSLQMQVAYTYSKCIDNGSVSSGLEQGAYEVTDPYNQNYDRGRCAFDITHAFGVNSLYALPFRGNRIVQGWEVSEILSASTGEPINIQNGLGIPGQALLGGIEGDRPNYSGAAGCNPNQILHAQSTPGSPFPLWFNPACYALEPIGTLGDVGRDTVTGPGLLDLDFAVLKNTKISERVSAQFRAEFFNIINHTNFANPPAGSFNTVFTGAVGAPIPNPNAGRLNATVTSSRQVQLALKFIF